MVNETEAPTSGATEQNLVASLNVPSLDEEQRDFVSLMTQYYGIYGSVMSPAQATDEYLFTSDEFLGLISNEYVQSALVERGVVIPSSYLATLKQLTEGSPESLPVTKPRRVGKATSNPEPPEAPKDKWQDKTLTPIQLMVANAMLDLVDTRSQKKKLQDMGVSTAQYQMWLKSPVFSDYLKLRAEAMLGENQHEAHLALIDKVRMGDMKAIAYYNEMTGRYTTQSSSTPGTSQVTDFKNLLIKILEIINDEIQEPAAAMRIAEKFKTLMTMNRMADELVGNVAAETFDAPEVMENRELSPRLKQLMDSGNGYE